MRSSIILRTMMGVEVGPLVVTVLEALIFFRLYDMYGLHHVTMKD